jgi:ubiquinone biosynthesis protein COQ4
MTDAIDNKEEWEESLLTSFFNMVRASDGNFAIIDQLSKASSDSYSLQSMVERLSRTPQGKEAFKKRLSLGSIDLEQLGNLPSNTLGYLYAEHMSKNQLKPLEVMPFENDYQFLGSYITETHDIWHVVTGSETDILGEIQLEAFYVAQLEVSRFWLALLVKNLLKSTVYNIDCATQYMESLTNGWIMGRNAKPLFGIDWSTLWEIPLEQIRASLNVNTRI